MEVCPRGKPQTLKMDAPEQLKRVSKRIQVHCRACCFTQNPKKDISALHVPDPPVLSEGKIRDGICSGVLTCDACSIAGTLCTKHRLVGRQPRLLQMGLGDQDAMA